MKLLAWLIILLMSGCGYPHSFHHKYVLPAGTEIHIVSDRSLYDVKERIDRDGYVHIPSSCTPRIWVTGYQRRDGKISVDKPWVLGHEIEEVLKYCTDGTYYLPEHN